jgi:shikimate dehydrogenase
MDIFAVTGKPVFFSRSPQIYNLAFSRLRYPAVYTRLAADTAEEALRLAREIGLRGLNVTAPFKEDMARLMDRLDPVAGRLRAVNTVLLRNGRARGFNTDPAGVDGAFRHHGLDPRGQTALVIGAGGAGRAAAAALVAAGAEVTLVNRTLARARSAAAILGCAHAAWGKLSEAAGRSRIIVSAVGGGLDFGRAGWIRPGHVLLEADYRDSPLSRSARETGCLVVPGTDWLLFQAVAALKIFTGRDIEPRRLRPALSPPRPGAPAGNPARDSSVSLVGMMGAGKSTIGKKLAAALGRPFVDTDLAIEQTEGRRIPSLFKDHGERAFRRLEGRVIGCLGRERENTVFALGGGAVGLAANRKFLAARSRVIWLWADPKTLLSRISKEGRPLLEGPGRPGKLRRILARRLLSYASASDFIVNAAAPPAKIVRKILHEIR